MAQEEKNVKGVTAASREFVAPGRVNLLGEHTDYTGGLVMPMAIPFATVAALRPVDEERWSFSSEGFEQIRSIAVNEHFAPVHNWSDYSVGVLHMLLDRGIYPPPFALRVRSDVPLGSGLSSSAALEVASAMAMLVHANANLPAAEIALLCQRAENDFVGSPCGIMDQFVSTAAEAGHALLLDTASLAHEQVPMNTGELAGTRIVVCNSMVKHSIKSGSYGGRRNEVERGQEVLRARFPLVLQLGDATLDQLQSCEAEMSPESFRRCRHIITENTRVRAARDAMLAGDARCMGELMLAGHASERDDFECSVEEVDFLVETAADLQGCFGARLTGGGFGGCTVNLVSADSVERFVMALKDRYSQRFGIHAETYICEATDGAVLRNAGVARLERGAA
jgi:galactokinase